MTTEVRHAGTRLTLTAGAGVNTQRIRQILRKTGKPGAAVSSRIVRPGGTASERSS
ncbi:MAG TPA: hypothetical protein VIA06_00015 [Candidatus Dormibacteraeota bacterium]|jgi:hypothetical protein|nr:hypothetical protein [Candidatus Dormibacteraeota bacterium]